LNPLGMNPERVARKIAETVRRVHLDLSGLDVLTEAATGPYAVTPVIAAYAGARVTALTKDSRYGTPEEVRRQTNELATEMGAADRIEIVESLRPQQIARADIVTNSGHLRPIDARFVRAMTPGTVVPLMYESWELREGEIDLDACRRRGIVVAGTNERHPNLRVFDYLGLLAVQGLFHCGVPAACSRLLLVCDNPFRPYIRKTLSDCGATVDVLTPAGVVGTPRRCEDEPGAYDGVIVADTPGVQPTLGKAGEAKYAVEQLGEFDALVQIWGDVDRAILRQTLGSRPTIASSFFAGSPHPQPLSRARERGVILGQPLSGGVICHPTAEPARGHMGMLPSELGPDPIIRLQAGGLKVGQHLASQRGAGFPTCPERRADFPIRRELGRADFPICQETEGTAAGWETCPALTSPDESYFDKVLVLPESCTV